VVVGGGGPVECKTNCQRRRKTLAAGGRSMGARDGQSLAVGSPLYSGVGRVESGVDLLARGAGSVLIAGGSGFGSPLLPGLQGRRSRLAALGPVGPPLTAVPLRLNGNECPLTRTSLLRPSDQKSGRCISALEISARFQPTQPEL